MAKGIRSYGPGKFNTILDSYVYEMTLDGGVDEQVSSDSGEWYGFIQIDQAFADRIHEIAKERNDRITDEEQDLLDESEAIILFQRSDGIIESSWFDDPKEAEDEWADIEKQFEDEEEEYDEEEEDEEDDEEDEDFDLESELESGAVIQDARGGRYSASFDGKRIGDFGAFDDALIALYGEAEKTNYFPNFFYVNDRGNTDLLSVEARVVNGKAVSVTSTTVKSWV